MLGISSISFEVKIYKAKNDGYINMKHIQKCKGCKKYTLKDKCPKCGEKTVNPKPAKYSPDDRMGKYRRLAKKERGLL